MTQMQRYIFADAFRAFLIILAGVVILAVLVQGLSQIDLVVESRQSAAVYFKVVMLGSPKVLALIAPLGLFVACAWSLNRIHRDSELVVASAVGMTPWQMASPLLRLASMVAILHLTINLWVQPDMQREMRATLHAAKADLASLLIRPGEFTTAGEGITFFARDNVGGTLKGLLISDTGRGETADYLAESGQVRTIDGKPALVMTNGQIHQLGEDDALSILDFDQYVFDLAPLIREETDIILKASDRFLPELLRIDPTNYYEASNQAPFLAEAHYRLTSPILSFPMVLLAVLAVLGGDFSRSGYFRRIGMAGIAALSLLFAHLAAQASADETPALNWLQWAVPLLASAGLGIWRFADIRSGPVRLNPA